MLLVSQTVIVTVVVVETIAKAATEHGCKKKACSWFEVLLVKGIVECFKTSLAMIIPLNQLTCFFREILTGADMNKHYIWFKTNISAWHCINCLRICSGIHLRISLFPSSFIAVEVKSRIVKGSRHSWSKYTYFRVSLTQFWLESIQ